MPDDAVAKFHTAAGRTAELLDENRVRRGVDVAENRRGSAGRRRIAARRRVPPNEPEEYRLPIPIRVVPAVSARFGGGGNGVPLFFFKNIF